MTHRYEVEDVLVIGAGLAGLATALLLHAAGRQVRVVEARERAGGRIHSLFDESGEHAADLGPTWIWTPYQPVAGRWLHRLGLEVFDQHEDGPAMLEHGQGAPVPARIPAQLGSQRVVGGSVALIDRLVASLPADTVRTGCPVTRIAHDGDGVALTIAGDASRGLRARHAVVAMPLRLAAATLDQQPGLAPTLLETLAATPTWMAAHAKVVVRYERAFWREQGLSGRIVSRVGPMVEAHDHCGPDGSPAALFGFVGWPAEARERVGPAALERAIREQLQRCFGGTAPPPLAVEVHDWARSPFTASDLDLSGPMPHPSVCPGIVREPHLGGRLWFAASETSTRSPGLIEGAFDAAERTAAGVLELG